MSTKSIRSLNREQRDTSRKEIATLKQENKQLKRTISRLQIEIEKRLSTLNDPADIQLLEEVQVEIKTTALKCPNCDKDGEIGSYKTMSGKIIYGCKKCKKWKHRDE